MANSKRKFQSCKKPLRVLLKEIDRAADAYARNGYRDVVGKNYLRTPTSLEALLVELTRYHPLSLTASWHGRRVLRKIHHEEFDGINSRWLEDEVKRAFQIRGRVPRRGALGRDIVRIAESVAEPFEVLAAAICEPIVIIREMFKK